MTIKHQDEAKRPTQYQLYHIGISFGKIIQQAFSHSAPLTTLEIDTVVDSLNKYLKDVNEH